MLKRLEYKDLSKIQDYLSAHLIETVYLRKPVEYLSDHAAQGVFYGFFEAGTLLGVFYFSNKNSMLFHYCDPKVLRHLDLLRAVRHHQPKFIKGEQHVIDGLYQILYRSFSDIRVSEVFLMSYSEADVFKESEWVKAVSIGENELEYVGLDMGMDVNWSEAPQFFVDVENVFGRQRQSVNEILKRNRQRLDQGDYLIVLNQGVPIAQGLIEEETDRFAILGGIYTAPAYRRKGFGAAVSMRLTQSVLARGKIPVLFVEKRNVQAQSVYEKIGYVQRAFYSILTVAY